MCFCKRIGRDRPRGGKEIVILSLFEVISAYLSTLEGIRTTWTIYLTLSSGVMLLWSTSPESTRTMVNVLTVWVFLVVVNTLLLLSIMTNYGELAELARIAVGVANQTALERVYTGGLDPGAEKWVALTAHLGASAAFLFAGRSFARIRTRAASGGASAA